MLLPLVSNEGSSMLVSLLTALLPSPTSVTPQTPPLLLQLPSGVAMVVLWLGVIVVLCVGVMVVLCVGVMVALCVGVMDALCVVIE